MRYANGKISSGFEKQKTKFFFFPINQRDGTGGESIPTPRNQEPQHQKQQKKKNPNLK